MKRIASRILLSISVVALAACAAAPPTVDVEAEKTALRAVAQQFQDGINAGNVDAVLALYAPEFVIMPNAAESIRTTDALRSYLSGFVQMGVKDLKITSERIDVAASGDLATDAGTFAGTMTTPSTAPFSGRYLVVSKKIDGAWKLVMDMDNLPIAPPAAPAK